MRTDITQTQRYEGGEEEAQERDHSPVPHVECLEGGGAGTPVLLAPQGGEEDRNDAEDGTIYRPSDDELRRIFYTSPKLSLFYFKRYIIVFIHFYLHLLILHQ